jgi:hypothetical protein
VTDDNIRSYLAGIPAGRHLLDELEQLRQRDAEHAAGEKILRERIQALKRTIEVLKSAAK